MSNDYFCFRQFTIHQQLCAMKVGTDGTLLGAWAGRGNGRCRGVPPQFPSILDIGTGTGLIALMMAQRFPQAVVTAIDIDSMACKQAAENVAASPFKDRIKVINISLQCFVKENDTVFDCIVCNPPFFTSDLLCPDKRRTTARHAVSLSYRDLFHGVASLISDIGEFSVIIPTECLRDFETEAVIAGFHTHRSCAVKTTTYKPPRRYLLAFGKQKQNVIGTSEIIIGSDYYKELIREFYL